MCGVRSSINLNTSSSPPPKGGRSLRRFYTFKHVHAAEGVGQRAALEAGEGRPAQGEGGERGRGREEGEDEALNWWFGGLVWWFGLVVSWGLGGRIAPTIPLDRNSHTVPPFIYLFKHTHTHTCSPIPAAASWPPGTATRASAPRGRPCLRTKTTTMTQ